AVVVLAAGLLALLSFHSAKQRTNADAKIQAEAVALAESKLQELESYLTDGDGRLDEGVATDTFEGLLATYTWTSTVEDIDDDGAGGTQKKVTVEVEWEGRDGGDQIVELSSDIYFRSPTEGVGDFMKLLVWTRDMDESGVDWGVDNGENPGGENPSDPGDNTDNGDSTDPDANPVISQYQVEINGAVSGANITQADGVLNVSGSPNIVSGGIPSCVITTGNKSFTCTVTYMAS